MSTIKSLIKALELEQQKSDDYKRMFEAMLKVEATLRGELAAAYRLIADANSLAFERGDKYGLCDDIDNSGNPYPSAWCKELTLRAVENTRIVDKIPGID
jgi:hypothetical protein